MYRTIVVGYKHDQRGEDAMALARLFACADGVARVVVVEVVHKDADGGHLATVPDGWPSSVDVSVRSVAGSSAGGTLVATAKEEDADLVILGSTHRGFAGRVLMGTTAGSILPEASCPVAVAPEGYARAERRMRRLGVAYDGTEESQSALEWAREVSRAYDVGVRLVAVVEPPPPPVETWANGVPAEAWSDAQLLEQNAEVVEALRDRARTDLAAASDSFGRADTETVVVVGGVRQELREAADDLDLLVVGSHGRGALAAALGGSVSRGLVHSCPAPLVVVPQAAIPARRSP